MKMELVTMDINDVVEKYKIREDHGDLTPLERSIEELGLIFPIIINQDNCLISGSRRLAACKNIGRTQLNALRIEVDEDSMLALDIRTGENLCRKALTSTELEREIELKKRALKDGSPGVINKLKSFFGNEQD